MQSINPLVLVFVVVAIVSIQKSTEQALINVLLPVMLLVPFGFSVHIPHLPALTCTQAVILPIGIAALITRFQLWRFKRADIWVLAFVLASSYSDSMSLGFATALFNFPAMFCETFIAYTVGKLLIEQSGLRERFVQRSVLLLSAVGAISVTEFLVKKNLFIILGRRFQSDGFAADQMRGRFLRAKGPFAGPEQAGIVFLLGIFLALWLWKLNRSRNHAGEPKYLGLWRSTICFCGIALGLYMTLSRGPWLGVVAGFLVARVGMVKNKGLAIGLALVLAIGGGYYASVKSAQLAQLGSDDLDETTSSAHYRTQLMSVYKPVAEAGGLFGWSISGYPRDSHFDSIDNEYLLVWVTQGKVGLGLFIAIAAEGVWGIFIAIRRSWQRMDVMFYYCLGGFLAGLLLVLSTVYLTAQGYVFFFLIVGWTQSLRDQSAAAESLPNAEAARFAFRRVFA